MMMVLEDSVFQDAAAIAIFSLESIVDAAFKVLHL